MTETSVTLKTTKTMKKFFIFLSAALASLALASCQKEIEKIVEPVSEEHVPNGSIPFALNASIAETKTSLDADTWAVTWNNGDIMYAVTEDEQWGVPYADDHDAATVAEFTYSSATGRFNTSSSISDGEHTFRFLYTNGTQKSFHRGASTTHQLPSTQNYDASDHNAYLKNYDVLAGKLVATTPCTLANVTMAHVFALMKVTLKNRSGANLTLSSFEMIVDEGQYLYGIYNILFGATPSATYNRSGGNSLTVNISNGAVENGGNLDVYFIIPALTNYTGEVTFKVTDSNGKIYTKTNSVTSLTFAAGSYSTANCTIKTPDPEYLYEQVTSLANITAGEYIFVCDGYVMSNAESTSSGPLSATLASAGITKSGSKLTTAGKGYAWTLSGDSYTSMAISSAANASLNLYNTSNNNGVRVSTSDAKWTFETNGSAFALKNNSRYCAATTASTNPDWRSYTSKTAANYLDGGQVYLYKFVDTTPRIEVSSEAIDAPLAGGIFSDITYSVINIDESEVITCDGTVVTDADSDGTTVTYIVSAGSNRDGWIKISAGGITKNIVVSQGVASLSAVADKTTISADGGNITITVTANVDWDVTSSNDTDFSTSTSGNIVTVTVAPYTNTSENRDATITVFGDGVPDVNILITQTKKVPKSYLNIDFEAAANTYTSWTFNGITSKTSATSNVSPHGGTYFAATSGSQTGYIQTNNKIASPQKLSCYITKNSNNTATTFYIQVSTNGSSWTDVGSYASSSLTRGEWVLFEVSLTEYSNVYVRLYTSGGTAIRNVDDLSLEYIEAE